MLSKTSYFNKTLFWKNITRFWPLWLLYTTNWVLSLPLPFFLEKMRILRYGGFVSELTQRADSLLEYTSGGVFFSSLFSVLIAMAVFSYLYNSRAAGLIHSLPIRREGLFLTGWISGYCFMLIPHLLVALLTIGAEVFAGTVNLWNIWMWFLIQSGISLFFFSFAVFCAMFTGHLLALPAFYTILLFLALFFSSILDVFLSYFIPGFTASSPSSLIQWLTPVLQLQDKLYYRTVMEGGASVTLFTGFQYVLVYMLVAVVLTAAALLLYRRRNIETAGDVIAVSWAKPLFKYGFSFCAALCGGYFLFLLFGDLFSSNWLPLTIFTVLFGAIGCFLAEMFLQKSFKVFHTFRSGLVFSSALLILMVVLQMDVLGLGTWVPAANEVESVSVSSSSLPPYDSASETIFLKEEPQIQKALALHQTIVDHREILQQRTQSYSHFYVSLDYRMKDGSSQRRSYSLEDEQVITLVNSGVLDLINDPGHLMNAYFPYKEMGGKATSIEFSVYNTETQQVELRTLDAVLTQQVIQAMEADIQAGRLGIHYLDDEDPVRMRNCSYYDFSISWIYTDEDDESHGRNIQLTPQFTAAETMGILTRLGFLDDTHILRSVEEVRAEEEKQSQEEIPLSRMS